jgi:hypothetical protein
MISSETSGHHGGRGFMTAAIFPTVAGENLKLFKCALQQRLFGDRKPLYLRGFNLSEASTASTLRAEGVRLISLR